ncbi:unnamed protein product [Urochloa humidicola]
MRHHVRSSSATTIKAPVNDGSSWSKYGQKKLLGAKYPRAYYRCTHRHSQGCLAMKHQRRTDEDPTLFFVIYHGEHTCVDANLTTAVLAAETEGLPALATVDPQGWSATAPSSSTPARGYLATAERSLLSSPSKSENWGVPADDGHWSMQNEIQEVVASALVVYMNSLR